MPRFITRLDCVCPSFVRQVQSIEHARVATRASHYIVVLGADRVSHVRERQRVQGQQVLAEGAAKLCVCRGAAQPGGYSSMGASHRCFLILFAFLRIELTLFRYMLLIRNIRSAQVCVIFNEPRYQVGGKLDILCLSVCTSADGINARLFIAPVSTYIHNKKKCTRVGPLQKKQHT